MWFVQPFFAHFLQTQMFTSFLEERLAGGDSSGSGEGGDGDDPETSAAVALFDRCIRDVACLWRLSWVPLTTRTLIMVCVRGGPQNYTALSLGRWGDVRVNLEGGLPPTPLVAPAPSVQDYAHPLDSLARMADYQPSLPCARAPSY
jgi:hypothetical protein